MAKMHFVTGKGGVGKSTYAASLARQLAEQNPGDEILLIDIQGSGFSLEASNIPRIQQLPFRSETIYNLWGCRILPFETFKEYFSVLLAMGNTDTRVAQFTSIFRDKLVDVVVGNRAIEAFIHACPGLEPAVLLGKLEYESKKGKSPHKKPWAHIVVDAPATGHCLMLFRSTFALIDIFSAGVVFKQAREIREFVCDPYRFSIHLVSIPEELPVRESGDLKRELLAMNLKVQKAILNRSPIDLPDIQETLDTENTVLLRELQYERELIKERHQIRNTFLEMHADCKIIEIPEFLSANQDEVLEQWKTKTHLV